MGYDVAVIGGGPGGYVAAIRAAQLGGRVLLVEKGNLGGVCLNRGCIPTKTLLKSAEKWQELARCGEFGLTAENIGFDYRAIIERKNKIVAGLRGGIEQLVKSNDIKVIRGVAAINTPQRLTIRTGEREEEVEASSIIIATGSTPSSIPVPGHQLPAVITSDELLEMTEVPKSMLVIGAGVVGIEFSAIMRAFGCEVTVVEMLPTILPMVDSDLVKRMGLNLRRQGIKTLPGAKVTAIEEVPGGVGVLVTVDTGKGAQKFPVEKVLVAAGRRPVTEGLGLDEIGVAYDRAGIKANEHMETNIPGIYAIGDVTGQSMLAHTAAAAGMVAAENALGISSVMDFSAIPSCIFTTPEIAIVGLTEEAAKRQNIEFKSSKVNFAANGKAVTMGETEGLVKIIAESASGKVLGMHIMGPHASDLIMEGALAIKNGLTAHDIAHTIHPHPTLTETVMESAHGIFGDSIHQVKLKLRK